ncbi:MAG: 2-oxoacid:acceptor oxidoreductase subunit alpha [bacterium]|nr:2-oxoacid:acceptor oxidoreductase subunit alpha [bacterium]
MTDTVTRQPAPRISEDLDRLVIRFAGDSGDGMQLTGDRFTSASALFGNDLATLPDFPAEIRAPAGTLHGVSAFQVQVASETVTTPGDAPTVLVAMNPAALRSELDRLEAGGTVIVNSDAFEERNLDKAGYTDDPLTDGTLDGYTTYLVPMTSLTKEVCKDLGVKPRDAERSKNFFALGVVSWLFDRPTQPTLDWIDVKFGRRPLVAAANTAAFKAGHAFGETAEMFQASYTVQPAELEPGTYTSINGSTALSWGLIAAAQQAKLPLFLASYPITPASDVLHELSGRKNFGVRTFQAEDEIAAVCAAVGASFGGHIGVTTTSGPGLALKAETIGLALSIELPLLVIDIQRGGPSTGLPTKTEASDLNLALYGRHGEAPLPVVAAYSPSQCFFAAVEAVRIALKYRTPVILLSDGYLANGSEPWRLPDLDDLPDISVDFTTRFNDTDDDGNPVYRPYKRDPETLARPWAIPGTPDLMHRVGGLEKEDVTGNISYTPANHGLMTELRAAKVAGIAADIPPTTVDSDGPADAAVLSWGSVWGAVTSAVRRVRAGGAAVDHLHLTHLNPLPTDLGDLLGRYRTVLVPEMNLGQLASVVRSRYLIDVVSITKVEGVPFTASEIAAAIAGATSDD